MINGAFHFVDFASLAVIQAILHKRHYEYATMNMLFAVVVGI